ncbi:MAG: gamma carbonic anhydrase family protein [Actinobacteria bacterium]|nr:gamma carbonic anhydrase family protein [Actinomycetota bacterium]
MPLYRLGEYSPVIHPDAYVHEDAILIGRVEVGAESTIWPTAVLRGDGAGIYVGERTSIQDGCIIHNTDVLPTRVGSRVTVGHNTHLEGCTVEDDCLIGSGSTLLPEAVVRRNSLVGANALIPGSMEVPSFAMALGVPAKIKPDSVSEGQFIENADAYVARGKYYREYQSRI